MDTPETECHVNQYRPRPRRETYQYEEHSYVNAGGRVRITHRTDEKGYLVNKPTLTTKMVNLVIRPPNLT